MARDKNLSLRDVQFILGHAHLSTTADVYAVEDEASIVARVAEHLAAVPRRAQEPAMSTPTVGYDAEDLSVLFGRGR